MSLKKPKFPKYKASYFLKITLSIDKHIYRLSKFSSMFQFYNEIEMWASMK